jgi:asparagine synthase (glutamine-hydrolysing)
MCGIFGFVGFKEQNLLKRMGEVIQHRGPDDVGYYNHDKVSLGIRRLSIIDLDGGRQPIYNEDRSLAVVYNGEIYNYLELFKELKNKGHEFRTQCDTEVIVHAYEEYGLDFLEKFNGMFAFALYDQRQRELIIARDRTGIKPLYYYQQNGKFIFASEIKAILESDIVERRCNTAAIDSYLELRYVPQPDTLFDGIQILPAAHYLRLKDNHLTIERYWDIPLYQGHYKSDDYYKERFEEVFLNAVKLQMRSDVPVGAYLSGGVDSSMVVAAMRLFTDKVKTFSIGFDSPVDETTDARQFANSLQCDHHEIKCLPEHFALLPKVIWHLERPIGDALILAYYLLAQETARHVKVVLSGEGADENFAGYLFHKIIKWTQLYSNTIPEFVTQQFVVPFLENLPVKLLNKLFIYPAYLGERGKEKVVEYLKHYSRRTLNRNYVWLKSLFDPDERQSLYSHKFQKWIEGHGDFIFPNEKNGNETLNQLMDRLLKLQFDDWLQDNLLLRQDKSTMAHSIEMRVPFLDHNLVELAFQMPAHLKVRFFTDKYIERDLAKKMLPNANAKRSKNPFYIPLEYFHQRSEIQDLLRLTLNRAQVEKRGYFDYQAIRGLTEKMNSGEFLYIKQVMSLVILELWHLVFIDKQKLW